MKSPAWRLFRSNYRGLGRYGRTGKYRVTSVGLGREFSTVVRFAVPQRAGVVLESADENSW